MSAPRDSKPEKQNIANDNGRKSSSRRKPVVVELRLPPGLPVQLVEVEVLAELLESLPRIANDNGDTE